MCIRDRSDDIDKCNRQPEEDGEELTDPKYPRIASSSYPCIGGLETPFLLIVIFQLSVPLESNQLRPSDVLSDPEVHAQQKSDKDESQQVLVGSKFEQQVPWL